VLILAVDPDQDGRGLQTATGPAGDEHRPVVARDQPLCVCGSSRPTRPPSSPSSAGLGAVHGCACRLASSRATGGGS